MPLCILAAVGELARPDYILRLILSDLSRFCIKNGMNPFQLSAVNCLREELVRSLSDCVKAFISVLSTRRHISKEERQLVERKKLNDDRVMLLLDFLTAKDTGWVALTSFLDNSDRTAMATKLKGFASNVALSPNPLQRATPLLQEFLQLLAVFYQGPYASVPTYGKHSRNVKDTFVELTINDNTGSDVSQVLLDYADVLTSLAESSSPGVAVIEGDPGSGKTTLLKKIANVWAEGGAPQFDLVLVVPLRSIGKFNDFVVAAVDYICKSLNYTEHQDFILHSVRSMGTKVLLVFDGLDEYRHYEGSALDPKLGQRSLMFPFRLLVTSRPYGYRKFSGSVVPLRYSICNLDESRCLQFATTYCKTELGQKKVMDYVQKKSNFVVKVPLIMMYVCYLSDSIKEIPDNITLLYEQFIRSMMERQINEKDDAELKEVIDLERWIESLVVRSTARLAFFGCQTDKLVFNLSDTTKCATTQDNILCGFLLTRYDTTEKGLVEFPHRSMQEYFASLHMCRLLCEGVYEPRNKTSVMQELFKGGSQFGRFFLGTCSAKNVLNRVLPTIQPSFRDVEFLEGGYDRLLAVYSDCLADVGHGDLYRFWSRFFSSVDVISDLAMEERDMIMQLPRPDAEKLPMPPVVQICLDGVKCGWHVPGGHRRSKFTCLKAMPANLLYSPTSVDVLVLHLKSANELRRTLSDSLIRSTTIRSLFIKIGNECDSEVNFVLKYNAKVQTGDGRKSYQEAQTVSEMCNFTCAFNSSSHLGTLHTAFRGHSTAFLSHRDSRTFSADDPTHRLIWATVNVTRDVSRITLLKSLTLLAVRFCYGSEQCVTDLDINDIRRKNMQKNQHTEVLYELPVAHKADQLLPAQSSTGRMNETTQADQAYVTEPKTSQSRKRRISVDSENRLCLDTGSRTVKESLLQSESTRNDEALQGRHEPRKSVKDIGKVKSNSASIEKEKENTRRVLANKGKIDTDYQGWQQSLDTKWKEKVKELDGRPLKRHNPYLSHQNKKSPNVPTDNLPVQNTHVPVTVALSSLTSVEKSQMEKTANGEKERQLTEMQRNITDNAQFPAYYVPLPECGKTDNVTMRAERKRKAGDSDTLLDGSECAPEIEIHLSCHGIEQRNISVHSSTESDNRSNKQSRSLLKPALVRRNDLLQGRQAPEETVCSTYMIEPSVAYRESAKENKKRDWAKQVPKQVLQTEYPVLKQDRPKSLNSKRKDRFETVDGQAETLKPYHSHPYKVSRNRTTYLEIRDGSIDDTFHSPEPVAQGAVCTKLSKIPVPVRNKTGSDLTGMVTFTSARSFPAATYRPVPTETCVAATSNQCVSGSRGVQSRIPVYTGIACRRPPGGVGYTASSGTSKFPDRTAPISAVFANNNCGNERKYSTDGRCSSWMLVETDPAPTALQNVDLYNTNGTSAISAAGDAGELSFVIFKANTQPEAAAEPLLSYCATRNDTAPPYMAGDNEVSLETGMEILSTGADDILLTKSLCTDTPFVNVVVVETMSTPFLWAGPRISDIKLGPLLEGTAPVLPDAFEPKQPNIPNADPLTSVSMAEPASLSEDKPLEELPPAIAEKVEAKVALRLWAGPLISNCTREPFELFTKDITLRESVTTELDDENEPIPFRSQCSVPLEQLANDETVMPMLVDISITTANSTVVDDVGHILMQDPSMRAPQIPPFIAEVSVLLSEKPTLSEIVPMNLDEVESTPTSIYRADTAATCSMDSIVTVTDDSGYYSDSINTVESPMLSQHDGNMSIFTWNAPSQQHSDTFHCVENVLPGGPAEDSAMDKSSAGEPMEEDKADLVDSDRIYKPPNRTYRGKWLENVASVARTVKSGYQRIRTRLSFPSKP